MKILVASIAFLITISSVILISRSQKSPSAVSVSISPTAVTSKAVPKTQPKTVVKSKESSSQTANFLVPLMIITPTPLIPTISPTPLETTPTTTPTYTIATTYAPTPMPSMSSTPVVSPSQTTFATPTHTPSPSPSTPQNTASPTTTPSESFEISLLTSAPKFKRGSTYDITLKSTPGSSCTLVIRMPVTGNSPSTVTHLENSLIWSWKVSSGTKLGTATLEATCTLGSQTKTVQGQIEIISAQ